ncbi:MAG: hypothetical protein MZV64_27910 [Ignavibacteriales bacterium]|nr:hypothetical protein [Ignavibacteriales bacterium]
MNLGAFAVVVAAGAARRRAADHRRLCRPGPHAAPPWARRWPCSCSRWRASRPRRGSWGSSTSSARPSRRTTSGWRSSAWRTA